MKEEIDSHKLEEYRKTISESFELIQDALEKIDLLSRTIQKFATEENLQGTNFRVLVNGLAEKQIEIISEVVEDISTRLIQSLGVMMVFDALGDDAI